MKNWFIGIVLLIPSLLKAEIIETDNIQDIYPYVEEGTLVLLGMTDTITDSSLSLGSKPWRQYIRRNLRKVQDLNQAGNLHDQWTYSVAMQVPVRPVQKEVVEWIAKLQQQDTPVFCLTGRGRNVWYNTIVQQVDQLTDYQLKNIGIHLEETKVPEALTKVDPQLFHHGIFYTDPYDKGAFIERILQETGYQPKKVVVVDDKWDQLKAVEEKLIEADIPHVCVLYQRAEKERKDFNPLITVLQLQALFETGTVITDDEAAVKASKLENPSADELFKKLVEKYGHLN
ncbi:MAG TPA: DUF2608 domain-containing protein [Rhabdochlamydiaceae bacterium]|nr:DUF2608 domain-containing protein [Rhabdochlamydiaceae bacterium]